LSNLSSAFAAAEVVERESSMELNEESLSPAEMKLLRDIILALRSLRYGSVNLTVHDGRLVEIQKVEKIRMNSTNSKE
jgi:hypothetical protein